MSSSREGMYGSRLYNTNFSPGPQGERWPRFAKKIIQPPKDEGVDEQVLEQTVKMIQP